MRPRLLFAFLGAAVLIGLALLLTGEELRDTLWLDLAPKSFRDAELQRFDGPTGERLYIAGTIHNRHLTTPAYSLTHLRALIAHLRPDVVLVEARPDEIARGNLGDGPIEALYAQLVARQAALASAGIDWWTMAPDHQVDSDARDDRMVANLLRATAGRPVALVLVGYSHAPPFRQRLLAAGWRPDPLPGRDKDRLFDTTGVPATFPTGMAAYVRRRIAADQASLTATADPFWRQRLQDAIAAREALLPAIAAAGEG